MEDVRSCEGCHVKTWSVELRQEGRLSCKQCWESQTTSGLPQPKLLFEALFDQSYNGEQADKERNIDRTGIDCEQAQDTSNFGSGNSCGNKDQEKCIVVNTPLGRIPKSAIVCGKKCKGEASETYTDEEVERSNGNNIVDSGPSPSPGPSVCDEVKERNTPKTIMVNTPGLQDDIENSCDKTFQNDDPSEAVKEDNRNEDEALVVLFADSLMPSLDRQGKGQKALQMEWIT